MKTVKKILIFTKEYKHPKISVTGGTGVFYKNLSEKLVEKGCEVAIFGSSKKAVDFEENGIHFKFVKDYFRRNKLTEFFRSVSGKIPFLSSFHKTFFIGEKKYLLENLKKFLIEKRFSPDIIETHDWEGTSLFLEETKIPYVVRYHGSWSVLSKYFGYEADSGKIYCEELALKKSKNNIVISEYSKKINQEIFGISTPELIYNGIDTEFFAPYEKAEIIPNSIFYLGEVKEEKGAFVAAQAFKIVKQNLHFATLHFIGNAGGNENKIKEIIGNESENSVFFYGRKNAEEIKKLVSKAEIMFFPSKGENFSLSLLEAMAMEKAVICSAIPSFTEIVSEGENGMIAENVDQFAEKAVTLLSDEKQREKIGKNARKLIKENFDIDQMVAKSLIYYQEIYERSE